MSYAQNIIVLLRLRDFGGFGGLEMHSEGTLMDLMQNYSKLFKIINFKGAGGPMFKTCQCAP